MQLLRNLKLTDVFVLDIETVPCVGCHDELDEMLRHLWEHKAQSLRRQQGFPTWGAEELEPMPDRFTAASLFAQAGIYAEFGRVVCISVGYFYYNSQEQLRFKVKSFAGDDETTLLRDFVATLSKRPAFTLCAHNGKEFDFPYLSRRMLINGVSLPPQLDIAGKKPWEVNHLDTMELWKFGDRKSYTSLALLAAMFGIPTPKDDISGADVARVYYEERDLPRIVKYCQKDIITTARVLMKFRGDEPFDDEAVVYADQPEMAVVRTA